MRIAMLILAIIVTEQYVGMIRLPESINWLLILSFPIVVVQDLAEIYNKLRGVL